ncbi:MAG: hypothetical protein K2L95_04390 [Alphaproteobacteria bacterium]|nr:hypothetical protein [Alphaproteobacteria bacterium]
MHVLLRLLANPKLLARFLRTPAGRRAALKYGNMVLKSKMAQDAIKKFMHTNNQYLGGKKDYAMQEAKFDKIQRQISQLQSQVDAARQDRQALETATFTMGRRVIELQRLYAQMQMELQRVRTAQMATADRAHMR